MLLIETIVTLFVIGITLQLQPTTIRPKTKGKASVD